MNISEKIIAFIPARYASSRLPGKPLVDICGKSLLQRVFEGVAQSRIIQRIIIATDDIRIADHCFDIGAESVMTSSDLNSGSDRIISAYSMLEEDSDIIINVQGDEPLINGAVIDKLITDFIASEAEVGTLIQKITVNQEIFDPSVVKVITDSKRNAIYFSRAPIPWIRDEEMNNWSSESIHFKHIGIYIYRKKALFEFGKLHQSDREATEKLEQLRFIDNGYKIFCKETTHLFMGVDTPEDLENARKIFSK